MEGWRQWQLGGDNIRDQQKTTRTHLTPTGFLMEGDYAHDAISERYGDVSTVICAGRLESGLATKLFVPQSLNGVQARGTDGRYHAADQPYGTEDNRGH